jgi:hypothetical protein
MMNMLEWQSVQAIGGLWLVHELIVWHVSDTILFDRNSELLTRVK